MHILSSQTSNFKMALVVDACFCCLLFCYLHASDGPVGKKWYAIPPFLTQSPIPLTGRNLRLQLTNLKFQVRWIQTHFLPLPPSVSQRKIQLLLQAPPLPIWPSCVSSSRPSTGRCRRFLRTFWRLLPRPFSAKGSHRRSCTRPSTS